MVDIILTNLHVNIETCIQQTIVVESKKGLKFN